MNDSNAVRVPPADQYNRELVEHTHPPNWQNPTPDGRYNLVVVGAGTAGLVAAAGAAGLGARVALVERHLLGGDCLNYGCVPSKALIRAAHAAADARHADRYGIRVEDDVAVDFPRVMERMRRLRASIAHHDSAKRFSRLGVDVFLGQAEFSASDTVRVGDQTLQFSKAVIATGARAAAPPIPGLEQAGYLTNETVFSLTERPRRVAIVGAGPIGCELAQSFARFGSQVTQLEMMPRILGRDDADGAALIRESMQSDGVEILLGAKLVGVSQTAGGRQLDIEVGDGSRSIEVDEILVAIGRAPNIEGLGLETVGVEFDRKGIKVDDKLRTTNKRILAAGDICTPYQFTHTADAMARIAIQNALFPLHAKVSDLVIPWCTYTAPEMAHVGLYPEDARKNGIEIDTLTQQMSGVDRSILDGDESGFARVHLEKGSDKIVGATVVARHAGDLIAEMCLAMTSKLGLGAVARTIHPYPTQAEVWKKIADAYNRTRLTPTRKRWLSKYLAWRR